MVSRASRSLRTAMLVTLVSVAAGACAVRVFEAFSHGKHLRELSCGGEGEPACLSCVSCHREGAAPESLAWSKPPREQCAECHRDEPSKLTAALHAASHAAAHSIVFDHERHLAMPSVGGQCIKCHDIAGSGSRARAFPSMSTCLGCHEHAEAFARNECGPCHESRDLARLRPQSFLNHDLAWRERHQSAARTEAATCALCHTQASCDGCHDTTQALISVLRQPAAVERELPHRFDYVSRHALESHAQPGSCLQCHATADCDSCHAQRGVSGGLEESRNPHPERWASGDGAALNLHGRAARRDIASCAGCHDQGAASNCVRCHAVGGFGGSPHPAGWRSGEPLGSPGCAPCHNGGRR